MDILRRLGLKGQDLPPLEARIACFREVLQANNAALGFLARAQEALDSDLPLPTADLRRITAGLMVQTYRMITNLNRMTGDRFAQIGARFAELRRAIAGAVEITPTLAPTGMVVSLADVGPALAEVVGGKSAYLGEARRILGVEHVPAGFATTADAYRTFMAESGLDRRLAERLAVLDGGDVAACFAVSAEAVKLVESARVPEDVSCAIEGALAALPPGVRLAVRSSALQEGGLEVSFAGQYRSLLNVGSDGVLDAFRSVIASKYSPQAITYRLGRGYRDEEVAMCCCVVAMVDAVAAGVLYTRFPTLEGARSVLQAVRGLGLSAVDGSAEPSSFIIERRSRAVQHKPGRQTHELRAAAAGEGTLRLALEVGAAEPVTREQALALAELGWRLEDALEMALDVEWAVDSAGRPWVLQVRPLSDVSARAAPPARPRVVGAEVLLEGGARASGGAAAGAVFHVESDLDLLCCPPAAVVVTREASPRLAVLLPRVAALVADLGEVTGHLATVARELRIPALFATRTASAALGDGAEVTVDADAGVVYAGRVAEALAARADGARRDRERDPNRERLAAVAHLIVPLTLRDRLASGFSPKRCKTVHDVIRFCHQTTVEAMFDLGDSALRGGEPLRKLVSAVPIDCRVFDLGGGLAPGAPAGEVELEHLACRPMRELWRGMTDPRLRWRQERPVSLRGFMSAVVNYNFDDDARMRRMGEPSYAFISAEYMNLNSRIGYHFATIDARVCEAVESNYASFRFVGGSTGIDQRSRRAQLIERLLARAGFECDCRADLVNCRVRHRPPAELEAALFLVGLLMGFVNHLDMALVSDEAMARFEREFERGNYGYKGDAADTPDAGDEGAP